MKPSWSLVASELRFQFILSYFPFIQDFMLHYISVKPRFCPRWAVLLFLCVSFGPWNNLIFCLAGGLSQRLRFSSVLSELQEESENIALS